MPINKAILKRMDNEALTLAIKQHALDYGWPNVAKVLREVVFAHVGWNSDFTELDNVLRRIERTFRGEVREVTEDKLDIPNLPDGDPADHFS